MQPYNFYRSLHARGENLENLAAQPDIDTSRSHLSTMFSSKTATGRGAHTRKHIAKYLTLTELEILAAHNPAWERLILLAGVAEKAEGRSENEENETSSQV